MTSHGDNLQADRAELLARGTRSPDAAARRRKAWRGKAKPEAHTPIQQRGQGGEWGTIRWLTEQVTIPATTISVVGYDPALGLPAWLADQVEAKP